MTTNTTPTISFTKNPAKSNDSAVFLVSENGKLTQAAKTIDKKAGGLIARAIKSNQNFSGKSGQTLALTLPEKTGYAHAFIVGTGKTADLDGPACEILGGKLLSALKKSGATKITLFAETEKKSKKLASGELEASIAAGFILKSYRFDRYKTKDKDKKDTTVKSLSIVSDNEKAARALFSEHKNSCEGVFLARDLVNEPPNTLYPDYYAKFLKKELTPLGIKVEIYDEKKLLKMGMGGIMAVGMGSARQPRMVVMRWNGLGRKKPKNGPFALVGKGVTFDTGGISIKPAAGMDEMKMDMGGSAAVAGAMKALALNKVKADVIGVIGLAENMPSHNAFRPGDIITSYKGKTIEILNTDAEGRLVLGDMLTYVQDTYKPQAVINLATLTGAIMVALGHEHCGVFANDEKLWDRLSKAGKDTSEKLWRMPLDQVWKDDMVSDVADLRNLGKSGRWGGACSAAGFLEHFIDDKMPWSHMDIAGTAWIKSDKPTTPKHGTGFGVRVLERLIRDHYSE